MKTPPPLFPLLTVAPRLALVGAVLVLNACGGDLKGNTPDPESDTGLDAGVEDTDSPGEDTPPDVPDNEDVGEGEDEEVGDPPPDLPETLGGERPARLVLPDDYTPDQSWPLLILLHGFGVSGAIQDIYMGLSSKAAPAGFIVLLPDGTPDEMGSRFWNATAACCDFAGDGPDDVAYISGLIEEAGEKLSVDPARVYLLGHSNGGFMSYRMACERADLITAVVVLAGAMLTEQEGCTPQSPVSVMHAHGTADETIFFEGLQEGNRADYPSALGSAQKWVALNACSETPEVLEQRIDLTADVPGEETQIQIWSGCQDGAEVSLLTMEGAPHIPAFTGGFLEGALEFFSSHVKGNP